MTFSSSEPVEELSQPAIKRSATRMDEVIWEKQKVISKKNVSADRHDNEKSAETMYEISIRKLLNLDQAEIFSLTFWNTIGLIASKAFSVLSICLSVCDAIGINRIKTIPRGTTG